MVRDRLSELRKNAAISESDVEIDIDGNGNLTDNKISQILSEYGSVRQDIDQIKNNIQTMRNLIYSRTSSFRHSKDKMSRLEWTQQENMNLCTKTFKSMKEFETNLPNEDDYTILGRIKRTNFYCIREDFLDAWRDHEEFLQQYENKMKNDLMRQAKIVDENITEEETEALIANNTTSLFVGNILEDTHMARQNLRELLVRKTELEKIEKSLTEVRDMFVRISTLVMEQNTMIQVIEYHAQKATINIEKGTEQLEQAREQKIKSLKRKTCILIWLAVILTILIIIAIIL